MIRWLLEAWATRRTDWRIARIKAQWRPHRRPPCEGEIPPWGWVRIESRDDGHVYLELFSDSKPDPLYVFTPDRLTHVGGFMFQYVFTPDEALHVGNFLRDHALALGGLPYLSAEDWGRRAELMRC